MDAVTKELVPAGDRALVFQAMAESEKFVTFILAEREMAVDIFQVKEIIRMPEKITAIPQSPDVVLGMIQLRGTLIPLVCLRRVFSLPEGGIKERKVLVTESRRGLVGLVVDEVHEVREIPLSCQEHPRSLRQDFSDRFIGGIANQQDRVTILLDLSALDSEYGGQML
jgi:purine-binding chemotaxis protein CheW